MQIPKEILSEKNYEGTRLILIENEKLNELQVKLDTLQKEVNPILDKLNKEYYPTIDPMYAEVREFTTKLNEKKAKIAEITQSFKEDTDKIDVIEQRATLIKNKMQPIIQKELEGKLGEFELAKHTIVKDGKIYVEVFDEIEEKIKAIRNSKPKK